MERTDGTTAPIGVPFAVLPNMAHLSRSAAVPRDFLTREPPEVHALGCFVHGALTALHLLGVAYNYRRHNWRDVAAHLAATLYDARSVRHHYRMEQIALRRRAIPAQEAFSRRVDDHLTNDLETRVAEADDSLRTCRDQTPLVTPP